MESGNCNQESWCCHLRSWCSSLREHCSVSTVVFDVVPSRRTTLTFFASVSLHVTTRLRLRVPLFVDCGFGIQNFHRVFDCDGRLNQTVVEFGHESFFGRSGPHASVVFQRSVHSFWFRRSFENRHGIGFPRAIAIWKHTALKEPRILSSFARASVITLRSSVSSDETLKIPLFRRASCNLVFSMS